jgi:hypothetical protein
MMTTTVTVHTPHAPLTTAVGSPGHTVMHITCGSPATFNLFNGPPGVGNTVPLMQHLYPHAFDVPVNQTFSKGCYAVVYTPGSMTFTLT